MTDRTESKQKLDESAPSKGGKRRRNEDPPEEVNMMTLMSSVPSSVWGIILNYLSEPEFQNLRQACQLFYNLGWKYYTVGSTFMVKPHYAHFTATPLWRYRSDIRSMCLLLDYLEDYLPLQEFWFQLPKLTYMAIGVVDLKFASRLLLLCQRLCYVTTIQTLDFHGAGKPVPSLPLSLPSHLEVLQLRSAWAGAFATTDFLRNPHVKDLVLEGRHHRCDLSSLVTLTHLDIRIHHCIASLPLNLHSLALVQHTSQMIQLTDLRNLTWLTASIHNAPMCFLPTTLRYLSVARPTILTNLSHLVSLTHLRLQWRESYEGVIRLPTELLSLELQGPDVGPTTFKLVTSLEVMDLKGAVLPRALPSKWVLPNLTRLTLPVMDMPVMSAEIVLMHLSRLPKLEVLRDECGMWSYPKNTCK